MVILIFTEMGMTLTFVMSILMTLTFNDDDNAVADDDDAGDADADDDCELCAQAESAFADAQPLSCLRMLCSNSAIMLYVNLMVVIMHVVYDDLKTCWYMH